MRALSLIEKNIIKECLGNACHAYAIILFGSAAQERLRDDSDVDLAFLCDHRFTPYELFMTSSELATSLGREVDLIDFHQASTVLQAHIVANGVLLLDERPIDRQYAFMRALKEYALLNEERHMILTELDPRRSREYDQRHSIE